MRRTPAILAALLLAVAVAGCGDDTEGSHGPGGDGGDSPVSSTDPQPPARTTAPELPPGAGPDERVRIRIRVRPGKGEDTEALTLTCAGRKQDLLCDSARALAGFLASESPKGRICTEIYGGPERARITGTIGDREIDRRFSRVNGCEVDDWETARPLLEAAVGR